MVATIVGVAGQPPMRHPTPYAWATGTRVATRADSREWVACGAGNERASSVQIVWTAGQTAGVVREVCNANVREELRRTRAKSGA